MSTIKALGPYLLPTIALLLMSNPTLAGILILDYLIFNPILVFLIRKFFPDYGLTPGGHIEMHIILLTYLVINYIYCTEKTGHGKVSVAGFYSHLSDQKMRLIFALVLILTVWTFFTSPLSNFEIAIGATAGLLIGLLYSKWNLGLF